LEWRNVVSADLRPSSAPSYSKTFDFLWMGGMAYDRGQSGNSRFNRTEKLEELWRNDCGFPSLYFFFALELLPRKTRKMFCKTPKRQWAM
jgi:hypothetical protein